MESNRNYTGTMKSAFAAGLIGLAALGCGGASFEPGSGTTEDGGDAAATGGAGGSAGHEGGIDAGGKGGKAGSGANEAGADVGGGDTGGAGGQPCKVDVQQLMNVGGEYVDTCGDDAGKCSDNVKMLCFTIMANCDAVLNEVTAEEQYVTSPTNGILSNGSLWVNDQIVKGGVFPVNVSAGTNKLVFAVFGGTIQNGALTKVCAGGDIKANSGGSAKLVINQGGLKSTPANQAGAMEGYQFTVNP